MVLANLIGNRLKTLYKTLYFFTVVLYLIFAVKLCLIILVVNLYIWHCTCSLVYWCTVHAKSVMNHTSVMFCQCPSPIFKMFVSEIMYEMSPHFKFCYLKWKWVESDRHFACYWYIWNTVQNRIVILLNYDI